MTSQSGLGGGGISTLTGTVAGIGGGALLLPHTGGDMIVTALTFASIAAVAMFISMVVAQMIRKTNR